MLKIQDSVHGIIEFDAYYRDNFIDTQEFQRLRRVEQAPSVRQVFPCATHDRFTHSLGVYHLGRKIVNALSEQDIVRRIPSEERRLVFDSYLMACLLHDVAHAPFSHSLEHYYAHSGNQLLQTLADCVGSPEFTRDLRQANKRQYRSESGLDLTISANYRDTSAPHELMSAIIAVRRFGAAIRGEGVTQPKEKHPQGCPELVARMITGVRYPANRYTFRNVMIELIHGDVTDADGLDYVCRDVWASGYHTASVNVDRLIRGIRICSMGKRKLALCFSASVINEVESLLQVKTFQQKHVINNYATVLFDHYLIEALKSAAVQAFPRPADYTGTEQQYRTEALQHMCSLQSFYNDASHQGISLPGYPGLRLHLPMEDDFVFLMKLASPTEPGPIRYIEHWLGHNYEPVPLWKTQTEFFHLFMAQRSDQRHKRLFDRWIFGSPTLLADVVAAYNQSGAAQPITPAHLLFLKATPRDKNVNISKCKVIVNDTPVRFSDLIPLETSYAPDEFYYLYYDQAIDRDRLLQALLDCWKKYSKPQ